MLNIFQWGKKNKLKLQPHWQIFVCRKSPKFCVLIMISIVTIVDIVFQNV